MSLKREVTRNRLREELKPNGMRSRCRKCSAPMVCKPEYGWICPECGWVPRRKS